MVQSEASSRASSRATSERPGASRTPQPPAKRRRGNQSEEADECFVREMTRLDERHADREERRAERLESRSTLDEDDIFGQQVAAIFKRINRVQKSRARIQVLQLLESIEFPPTLDDPYPPNRYNFEL